MHTVVNDRIFDSETGKEVMWRGAGGSYLFHRADYMTAYQEALPLIQQMGLDTLRLAFRFPDSAPGEAGYTAADTLDYAKLDEILTFLNQNGIKAILDCHNWRDMWGDFGSQKLIDDWVVLAKRYRGDSRIAAYELFNEPESVTWDPSVKSTDDVRRAYSILTQQIRIVDPEHIHTWTTGYFNFVNSQNLQPNVVYSRHSWRRSIPERYTVEEYSYYTLGNLVGQRWARKVPFWLGEFGAPTMIGIPPNDPTNPLYLLTEQLLFRCEEQVIGWNLWFGGKLVGDSLLAMFPLKIYNENLVRQPWRQLPNLLDFIVDHQGVDVLGPVEIQMWHNNDYVTFRPGIHILVITNRRLATGEVEVVSEEEIIITEQTTIRNEEGTTEHPGDWNIIIFPIATPIPLIVPLVLVGGVLYLVTRG